MASHLTSTDATQVGISRAPRGLDAANIWAGSLAVPEIADKNFKLRHSDLDSRTGRIMMLFKRAELLSWADEREPLYAPTRREAERLRALSSR